MREHDLGIETRRIKLSLTKECVGPLNESADGPDFVSWRAQRRLLQLTGNFIDSLLAVVVLQCIDQFAEVTRDDRFKVEVDVDAMIGAPVLGKVVGSDSFRSIAGTDEASSERTALLLTST